jgi:hypothetical protein
MPYSCNFLVLLPFHVASKIKSNLVRHRHASTWFKYETSVSHSSRPFRKHECLLFSSSVKLHFFHPIVQRNKKTQDLNSAQRDLHCSGHKSKTNDRNRNVQACALFHRKWLKISSEDESWPAKTTNYNVHNVINVLRKSLLKGKGKTVYFGKAETPLINASINVTGEIT